MSRFKAGTVVRRLGTVRVGRVVQQAPTDSTFETRLRWLDTEKIEVMPENLLTRRHIELTKEGEGS